jgi:hypothetical protein
MFRPGGFPVPSANGEFLMKNIALFGLTLWLLADAIDANPQTSNAGHQPYPSPSYARFGSAPRQSPG